MIQSFIDKPIYLSQKSRSSIFILEQSHCVKSVQIRSFFWSVFSRIWTECGEIRSISPQYLSVFSPNEGKYGTEKTPYLDTFHTVSAFKQAPKCSSIVTICRITSDSVSGLVYFHENTSQQ